MMTDRRQERQQQIGDRKDKDRQETGKTTTDRRQER